MDDAPAIGIDLGTTNSCVAVMRHGKVEVIANEQGYFVTPSYVAFTEFEILIGDAAKNQTSLNPEHTVFDAKRIIGREYDDPLVQNDMKNWPFTVKQIGKEPRIEVMLKGEQKLYAPEEISAMILHRMKEVAEAYLNQKVTDAVITVPAYFNNAQRQATYDAGKIAGLNVLRIINEPTAAAVAYNFQNQQHLAADTNVLVYDLGGGTFDVSVLKLTDGNIKVLATNGDTHLGGEDFDCALVEHCVLDFNRKHKIDILNNKRALRRLRTACESAKRCLSSATQHEIIVDSLAEGITFRLYISRSKFDDLNLVRFRRTLEPVLKALEDAKVAKNDINRILLVGGSTRIPKIQKLLQDFFDGKDLDRSVNPDEAIAYGAAVYAAALKGDPTGKVFGKLLQDVTPLSLGYDLDDKTGVTYTKIVIPRNSPIPVSMSSTSVNKFDNQSISRFVIRQGESQVPAQNFCLGVFTLVDLPLGPARSITCKTVFAINTNGILTVTATETTTGRTNGIKIENVADHLRKQQIERMIKEAERNRTEENNRKIAMRAKSALEDECYKIKDFLLDDTQTGSADSVTKSVIFEKCDEVLNWLGENPRENYEEYESRHAEVKSFSQKLWKKFKSIFDTD